jgi:hypothetical protein
MHRSKQAMSFDHLVGEREQPVWHRQCWQAIVLRRRTECAGTGSHLPESFSASHFTAHKPRSCS